MVKAQKANLQPVDLAANSSRIALSRLSHSNNDNIPIVVSIRLTCAPHSLRRTGILSTRVKNASYCNGDVDTNTMHNTVRKLVRDRTIHRAYHGDEVLTPPAPTPLPTTWAEPRSQKTVVKPPVTSHGCEPREVRKSAHWAMSDGSARKPVHETPFARVPAGSRKAARARTVLVGRCIFS